MRAGEDGIGCQAGGVLSGEPGRGCLGGTRQNDQQDDRIAGGVDDSDHVWAGAAEPADAGLPRACRDALPCFPVHA
jgi:hypothetical protein